MRDNCKPKGVMLWQRKQVLTGASAQSVLTIPEDAAQNVTRELSIYTVAPKDILTSLCEKLPRISADAEETCRTAMCFQGSGDNWNF